MKVMMHSALLVALLSTAAVAHDDDLHTGTLPRRTSIVSEEVARQRFATIGLVNIRSLHADGRRWVAAGAVAGRATELEIDATTGYVFERGGRTPLDFAGQPCTQRDYSVKVERQDISKQNVIVEPFAPERSSALRPVGEQPVSDQPDILHPNATDEPSSD